MFDKRVVKVSFAGLLSVLLVGVQFGSGEARAEGAVTKRIGVVSVSRVFKAYKKVADIQKKLEKLFDARKKAIEAKSEKLKVWSEKISMMTKQEQKSREALVEVQAFRLAEYDLKNKLTELAKDVEKKRMEEMKQVLREIRISIATVAKTQQYDLVMRAPEYDNDGAPVDPTSEEDRQKNRPQSSAQLVRRFRENPVLFYSPAVDITQGVIKKLNNDYASAGK